MRRRLFYIVSEVLLIILSTGLGTFIWVHVSAAFNSSIGKPLETLRMDLEAHWFAYVGAAIIAVLLVVVLYVRAKSEGDVSTKADIERNTRILILIAKNLGVPDTEIESEIQSKSTIVKKRRK